MTRDLNAVGWRAGETPIKRATQQFWDFMRNENLEMSSDAVIARDWVFHVSLRLKKIPNFSALSISLFEFQRILLQSGK